MKLGKWIAWLGLLAMTAVLVYGFVIGDFGADGQKIISNPWGIVSLVDLYVGFTLFSMWIVFREKNLFRSTIWVVLMMVFGFFTGSLYILYAFATCQQDWLTFFLGNRKADILANR